MKKIGFERFEEKCKELGISVAIKDEGRNYVILTFTDGKEKKYSLDSLIEGYGTLAFLHLDPYEAIDVMIKDLVS